jgi:hypothetical protein
VSNSLGRPPSAALPLAVTAKAKRRSEKRLSAVSRRAWEQQKTRRLAQSAGFWTKGID